MAAATITTHIGRQWMHEAARGLRTINNRQLALLRSASIAGGADVAVTWNVGDTIPEITGSGGYARWSLSGQYTVSGAPSAAPTAQIGNQSRAASGAAFDDFDMIAEIWTDDSANECIIQTWDAGQTFSVGVGSTFNTSTLDFDSTDA